MSKKLWGGRFEKATLREVEEFTRSIEIDSRLWRADLRGSVAHARMLGRVGVLTPEEARGIVDALESVERDLESDPSVDPEAEDIHSVIEARLRDRIGPLAGKLHTARSRNDQVATATRLQLRSDIESMQKEIFALQTTLLGLAEAHLESLLPGLTHFQHAQPVSLAHHLMAYFWMLQRDFDRMSDARKRVNVLPLGSAALAGTSFPVDRQGVAEELGFEAISENSLDAVSDRDFVVEVLSAVSLVMTHLSRLCEELILWSAPEFSFVELDDGVTTGSSIMPQKKNPDVAELIRGRCGRATGALIGALTLLKGLPLSYNRDLQEDKRFLFEGVDTARSCLRMMKLLLDTAQFRTERMAQAVEGDFSNATDLADYLVRRGMPFREAHEVVGKTVRHCLAKGIRLENINIEDLKAFSPLFGSDVLAMIQPRAVLAARTSAGGAGPSAVRAQLDSARNWLEEASESLAEA